MTLFWGDINFPSSRAINDDEDESEEEKELIFEKNINISGKNISKAFVFIGTNAVVFCDTYLIKSKEHENLGSIMFLENTLNGESLKKVKKCELYYLKNVNTLLMTIDSVIPPECLNDFTNYLMDLFNSKIFFYVFTTCHITNLKIDSNQEPCIRYLKTTTNNIDLNKINCLEQPNTLHGLPAAILSYCEIHRIKAFLFVIYSESFMVDIEVIRLFRNVFCEDDLKAYELCESKGVKKVLEENIKVKSNSSLFT